MSPALLKAISNKSGLGILRCDPVHGGDINEAYCLYTTDKKYFLKVNNDTLYPAMFAKEANGREMLNKNSSLTVPSVIQQGNYGTTQYLLLEWIEKGVPANNFWEAFGKYLALLHKQPQAYFGWKEDNYIGSLWQKNDRHNVWHSFYAACRIMPLVKRLFESSNFSKTDIAAAEKFCIALEDLFPVEQPSLLHGDLWPGNFMPGIKGNAVVYDPAVYFGHREMDIGMSLLFGGFDRKFYDAYNETYPLRSGWQQRIELTQLYPLLVHAVRSVVIILRMQRL